MRVRLCASTVSLSFVLVTMAAAQGPAADGPPKDFVTGGGHHSFLPDAQFTISAHSGPLGEDPKGHMSFKEEGQPRVRSNVTCLTIVGNQAFATGVIERPAAAAGQLMVMHAVDSGERGGIAPDLLRFSFVPFIVPHHNRPGCFLPVLPPVPVTQGNIVVNDAPQ
jgi:hypothetical protein